MKKENEKGLTPEDKYFQRTPPFPFVKKEEESPPEDILAAMRSSREIINANTANL